MAPNIHLHNDLEVLRNNEEEVSAPFLMPAMETSSSAVPMEGEPLQEQTEEAFVDASETAEEDGEGEEFYFSDCEEDVDDEYGDEEGTSDAVLSGVNLDFHYSPADGCFIMVSDLSKFVVTNLKSPQNTRIWMGNCLYNAHAMAPDFAAMRKGYMYLFECQGYDWKKNLLDLKTAEKYWAEIGSVYPLNMRKCKCFHTPTLLNCMVSMTRRFVPKEQFEKFQVGCQYNGTLSDLYYVPSQKAAEERLVARQIECLQRRYANEKAFSLKEAALIGNSNHN
ncbi:expressed unknown protein [Seminavis robusta]|uniref:Uncharacterized protein n=1 Tax=Seminavis robusta TaxID=568900 RepID=A0A9N8F1D7_9STRA|nr:expressed unknown protein [Seminavis robusta]|eukprot:Sro4127_g353080.1 n/a (279) ;mRNA; r:228-1433